MKKPFDPFEDGEGYEVKSIKLNQKEGGVDVCYRFLKKEGEEETDHESSGDAPPLADELLYQDEYTTVRYRYEPGEERLTPEDMMCLMDEDDIHRIEENRRLKRKESYFI